MREVFRTTTVVGRPAPQVWSVLTDWPGAGRWMVGVDEVVAEGPTVGGTVLTFRARGRDRQAEVLEADPPSSLRLRSVQGGVTAEYAYACRPVDDGRTEVELAVRCATHGVMAVLGPVVRGAIRRSDAGQLERLRTVVEATTART